MAAFHSQLKVLELLRGWKDGNPVLPVEDSDTDDASESSSDQDGTSDSEDESE